MDLSHFRFLVDYHFIVPLLGGDDLPYRSLTLGFISQASDLWFSRSAKGVLTVVSVVAVSLLSHVSHPSVSMVNHLVSKSITVVATPLVRNFDEVKSSKQKIHLQTEKSGLK
ncbi:hypothetical protein Bca4012_098930 [Brassica carinata]|uniref:Uncharacterized protein n=1 Tax=Brassica carinata TaxID=52824 RepID=A0A8X7PIY8_BRACI|nr:hypothetical protein Bca52824_081589 [Brassica carinata]